MAAEVAQMREIDFGQSPVDQQETYDQVRESELDENICRIESALIDDLDSGKVKTREEILKSFGYGFGSIILRFYDRSFSKQLDEGLKKQMEIVLEASKSCILGKYSDKDKANFLEEYKKVDIAYSLSNKKHDMFPLMVKLIEKGFETRVYECTKILSSTGPTYEDLIRDTFEEDKAREITKIQFDLVKTQMTLIKTNPHLVAPKCVPGYFVGRIVDIVEIAYENAKRISFGHLDTAYNGNGHNGNGHNGNGHKQELQDRHLT